MSSFWLKSKIFYPSGPLERIIIISLLAFNRFNVIKQYPDFKKNIFTPIIIAVLLCSEKDWLLFLFFQFWFLKGYGHCFHRYG